MDQENLNNGISAFRSGNKVVAFEIFSKIVHDDPECEKAWIWLAASEDNVILKEKYLNCALELNPDNKDTQLALSEIKKLLVPSLNDLVNNSTNNKDPIYSNDSLKSNKVEVQSLNCPMCGGSIRNDDVECSYCGSTIIITSFSTTNLEKLENPLFLSSANKWKVILEKDPENPKANYALGLYYLKRNLRDAALHHLGKARKLLPESAIVHYNYALALFNENENTSEEFEFVKKTIDYVIKLDPNFKQAKAFKHYFQGNYFIKYSNYSEAVKEFLIAVDYCSDIPVFQYMVGLCYTFLKKYEFAELYYLKAIEINPYYQASHQNLSFIYYHMEKYKEGVTHGKLAIELTTSVTSNIILAKAYRSLALNLWKTKQTSEARQMMERAKALNPNEPEYKEYLKLMKTSSDHFISLVVVFSIMLLFLFFVWIVTR